LINAVLVSDIHTGVSTVFGMSFSSLPLFSILVVGF
jgi:hypothetical protein